MTVIIRLLFCLLCLQPLCANNEKPFVMGSLRGQLGNQLFIIAATTSLALDHGAFPIFPDLAQKNEDNLLQNYKNLFPHLNTSFPSNGRIAYYYAEPHYYYTPIPYRSNICLMGYFQSEKYFRHHKKEILELFAPPKKILDYLHGKYGELLKHPLTVSVHMRFYADYGPEQEMYTKIKRSYFEKSIALFPEESLFLVFSNHMERCKKELAGIERNFYYIEGESHYHDFYLMSLCKHNIICNSSFSWWAAYLNPNPEKKIIAPCPWYTLISGLDFKDVIPDEWTVISNE